MAESEEFNRCIYCFAPKEQPGPCESCGYENGLCCPPGWWLTPGTLLKGRYIVGRHRRSTPTELAYLGWDLEQDNKVQVVEYYPEALVTRDITNSETISCFPGKEAAFEAGCQAFYSKTKLYHDCVSRVGEVFLDFFVRNGTCYYVRKKD